MSRYLTFNNITREVIGVIESTKWNAPRNAVQIDAPPEKEGFAIILNDDLTATEYIADFRGKTIYNTADPSESITVSTLGEIEAGWTFEKSISEFDEWGDGEWVTNEQALFECKMVEVDDIRRSLYSSMVDPLISEANIERLQGNEEAAVELENQAIAAREKIRAENPWPTKY